MLYSIMGNINNDDNVMKGNSECKYTSVNIKKEGSSGK